MKALKLLAVPAFAIASLASASSYAATASGTATVTIQAPIAIAQTTPMAVGTVIHDDQGLAGTATLDAATGAIGGTNTTTTGATRGVFTVTGASDVSFTLSALGTATFTNGTPAEDMLMTLTSDPAAGALTLTGGSVGINVGGSLPLAANQPTGAYTGTYSVVVNY